MPRRLVPSGRTGGSSFLLDSLVISEFCCTFAAETREDPFEGNVVDKAPTLSMSFPFSIDCCCWLARLSSCSATRRWQCFFDSVLLGQDVGESARGAARWTAPFH